MPTGPRSLALVLSFLLLGSAAAAETVEIPLPSLLGPYPFGDLDPTRIATVVLDQAPLAVSGISIRLGGTMTAGVAACPDDEQPWPLEFIAWLADPSCTPVPSANIWDLPTGPFSCQLSLAPLPPAGLAGTPTLEIRLFGAPAMLVGICTGLQEPVAQLEEAVLVIEGDFPVADEGRTWSAVKEICR
jgi:hypothetical protein